MGFRDFVQRLGGWKTLHRWNEPLWYRVQLKGDWLARLAWASAIGWIPTAILLVLFAINVRPPHPLFALIGMLLFGSLAFMFLFRGERTASGRIRLCEEGICRKRFYVGLSAQWIEEASWPFEQIRRGVVVPGQRIGRSYSLLFLGFDHGYEIIAVPASMDVKVVAQVMMDRGINVEAGTAVPPEFTRPLTLPLALSAGGAGIALALFAAAFYAAKVDSPDDREIVAADDDAQQDDVLAVPAEDDEETLNEEPVGPRPGFTITEPPPSAFPSATPSLPPATRPNIPAFPPRPPIPAFPAAPPVAPSADIDSLDDAQPIQGSPRQNALSPQSSAPLASPFDKNSTGKLSRSEVAGGPGGFPFESVNAEGKPVIGFRYRVGAWAGKSALGAFDPVFDRNSLGPHRDLVVARDGYVVAGLEVNAQQLVHAVRIIFARQEADGSIDRSDSYVSDWIGQRVAQDGSLLKSPGNNGIVGIYGRRGAVIDAIGLVGTDE